MLGPRYLACTQCETVFAVPADTETCGRCGADDLEALPAGAGATAYFSSAMNGH